MALLNTAQQQAPMQEGMPEGMQEGMNEENAEMGEERDGELTLTAESIGKEMMGKLDPNMQQALKQAVNAGMKILFDKSTHNQVFDSIRPDDEVPISDELGVGATHLLMAMYQQSQQSSGPMPPEIIIPCGAILLAKAAEFINETGMDWVSDEEYAEAFELFSVNIQDKLDPEYRQKNGLQAKQQAEQQTAQQPEIGAQQGAQQAGGLLNAGGAV